MESSPRPTSPGRALAAALAVIALAAPLFAMPASFTYQGSLKQNGTPVNATVPIEIRLTNSDGSQLYWTSGAQSVPVKEGLYRMELAPTGVNWSAIDPYIETKVNGTTLLPREKMTETIYAQTAKEIAPGGTAKAPFVVTDASTNTLASIGADGTLTLSDAGLNFKNEPSMGLYRAGAGSLFVKVGGNYRAGFYSGAAAFWTPIDPGNDGAYSIGENGVRWSAVWAKNGVIQTSSSKQKTDIRELVFAGPHPTLRPFDPATAVKAASAAKNPGPDDRFHVPTGIVFKWRDPKDGAGDNDIIGFDGDELPIEAHAIRPDGTRDPENFYASAVIGLLCAKVKQLESQVSDMDALKQRIAVLESAMGRTK